MNKEQKVLAEAYQAVLEANPIQQQMRDMMQQKMQQRIQGKATQPQQQASVQQQQQAEKQTRTCPKCGHISNGKFCGKCGENLQNVPVNQPQAQPTQNAQQTTSAPAQQQPQNTQQIQQGMAELGKQLTQFQQRFNEIMKSLGGTQPQQAAPTNQNQGWQKTGAAKMTKKY